MRQSFAHDAVVRMAAGEDSGAPGAAITVALCGHWEHEPPCPLAPHYTAAERVGEEVRLRILFATDPDREAEVRAGIRAALAAGEIAGPHGRTSRWRLLTDDVSAVRPDEAAHAQRLAAN